jgi:hypothetical protein
MTRGRAQEGLRAGRDPPATAWQWHPDGKSRQDATFMLLDESPGLERDGLMGLPWTA